MIRAMTKSLAAKKGWETRRRRELDAAHEQLSAINTIQQEFAYTDTPLTLDQAAIVWRYRQGDRWIDYPWNFPMHVLNK